MEQELISIGFILLFIGLFLIVLGGISGGSGKSYVAVGGFVGPIPFGFANNPRMLRIITIITICLFILFFLTPVILRYLR